MVLIGGCNVSNVYPQLAGATSLPFAFSVQAQCWLSIFSLDIHLLGFIKRREG
jgi:hypothetical protein